MRNSNKDKLLLLNQIIKDEGSCDSNNGECGRCPIDEECTRCIVEYKDVNVIRLAKVIAAKKKMIDIIFEEGIFEDR